MEQKYLLDASKDQLNRVLGFFSRADSKASVLLAVDTGMLALLATNAPPVKLFYWQLLFVLLPIFLIAASLWHLYKGAFPRLQGGQSSLIYFREIANRTENRFIDEFIAQGEVEYIKDMLGQTWRNSEIVKEKFDHLSSAFNWLALAILPWVIALAMFAITNTEAKTLLVK
jgi:hypothetical protein